MPVRVQALPEGTCIHAHVPIFQASRGADWRLRVAQPGVSPCTHALPECTYAPLHGHVPLPSACWLIASLLPQLVAVLQITAEGPYAPLCTYIETLLTQVSAAGHSFRAAGQHGLAGMALLWLVKQGGELCCRQLHQPLLLPPMSMAMLNLRPFMLLPQVWYPTTVATLRCAWSAADSMVCALWSHAHVALCGLKANSISLTPTRPPRACHLPTCAQPAVQGPDCGGV